jgi:SAM-dependent methyltransferase
MSVLDVGCGTAAITSGIARIVSPGLVVGLDRDPEILAAARQQYGDLPNLRLENGDGLSLPFESQFEVVNAARTLQWISEPGKALEQMTKAAKRGGRIVALDYNLEDNAWEPGIPSEFARFYRAFLDWRNANQWDNRMADHLPDLFRAAGIAEVQIHTSDETVERGDPGFAEIAGIWLWVTRSVGARIVAAGLLSETERLDAERSYQEWVDSGLLKQTLVMRTVEGIVV